MTLHVHRLSAGYGPVAALSDVSVSAARGSITAVLGPNGAGKSTLVRCLAGVHPHGGTITLAEVALRSNRPGDRRRTGLAAVSERRDLVPSLTVDRYLSLVLDRDGRRRAAEMFPAVGELGRQQCGVLSGGEAQMVALARAIAGRPSAVVVDEISQGLAPAVVRRLLPAVRQAADDGAAVILVEQYVQLAQEIADRVVLLDRGSVRYAGPASGAPIDEIYLAAG